MCVCVHGIDMQLRKNARCKDVPRSLRKIALIIIVVVVVDSKRALLACSL